MIGSRKIVGILGYGGFLGSTIYKVFRESEGLEVYGIDRNNWKEYSSFNFDYFIDADGNSSKFVAAKNMSLDFEQNALSEAKVLDFFSFDKIILISTIDVYNDKSMQQNNSEDSAIDPLILSNYGFSKYVRELLVRRHAKKWLILRLGGLIGDGLKKGPVYDILNHSMLYVSKESKFQFINTTIVSHIILQLLTKSQGNQVFNVTGRGQISMIEFASLAGKIISRDGDTLEDINVSVEKISKIIRLPATRDEIILFLEKNNKNESK